MKIAFVDDDTLERNKALPILLNGFQSYNIPVQRFDFFENGKSFLDAWKDGTYDLVILDIYMGELSGVDVANKVRERNKDTRIVFCSTSNEFANESYDVNACYYIQKPVTEKAVLQMIARLNIEDFELRRFITLPDGQQLILRNMIYAEYHNHQVEIFTKKGPNITTWISNSVFVDLLSSYDFLLPCNSGSVINLWEVSEMKNDMFIMSDSSCITISRRKKNEVKNLYHAFLLNSVKAHLTFSN
jgi:Response regulator of the LytR/AlgR family